jgi:hypothetical protein
LSGRHRGQAHAGVEFGIQRLAQQLHGGWLPFFGKTMAAQLLGHRGLQIGISHAEVDVFEHGMQASTGPRATRKGKRAVLRQRIFLRWHNLLACCRGRDARWTCWPAHG